MHLCWTPSSGSVTTPLATFDQSGGGKATHMGRGRQREGQTGRRAGVRARRCLSHVCYCVRVLCRDIPPSLSASSLISQHHGSTWGEMKVWWVSESIGWVIWSRGCCRNLGFYIFFFSLIILTMTRPAPSTGHGGLIRWCDECFDLFVASFSN